MRSFWLLVARLFGARRTAAAFRDVPTTEALAVRERPMGIDEVDFHDGAADVLAARAVLSDEERTRLDVLKARVIERFMSEKIDIAAFPSRAAQVLRILDEPNFDIGQLVLVTQRDPVISVSVLRAANSAAFAGITRIESVRDAVMRLGAQTVAGIATVATARGLFDEGALTTRSRFGEAYSRLWLQSVTTAFTAGAFASSTRAGDLERSFLSGMLHDIGKTVALRSLGGLVTEVHAKNAISPALLAAILEDVHVELGKSVASAWNLPAFVIDTCAKHHDNPPTDDRALNIVRVVSGLHELASNPQFREGVDAEVRDAAGVLGLDGYMLRALASQRRDYAAKAASL